MNVCDRYFDGVALYLLAILSLYFISKIDIFKPFIPLSTAVIFKQS